MPAAFITHADCLKHEMGAHHPERPERLCAIEDQLIASGLGAMLARYEAPLASDADLALVHPIEYVRAVRDAAPESGIVHLDPDTAMNRWTLQAALRAAGAAVLAVDLVVEKKATSAFCAVRPPGHHACRARPMGFCVFNNVAVAARHAQSRYGIERVAILDFDVHHGQGTQAVVELDRTLFYGSTHQYPLYPGTGSPRERGIDNNVVNVPLPAGAGGPEFRAAWGDRILPALDRFEPELVIISAGFDAHAADPLAGLEVETEDFVWLTQEFLAIADQYAQGRVVSVLEGGYDLTALAESVATHVRTLMRD